MHTLALDAFYWLSVVAIAVTIMAMFLESDLLLRVGQLCAAVACMLVLFVVAAGMGGAQP